MSKSKTTKAPCSYVGYVCGGALKKGLATPFHAANENDRDERFEELCKVYGSDLHGRYCKTTVEKAYELFLAELKSCRDEETDIYEATDNHCVGRLKEVTGAKTASRLGKSNEAEKEDDTKKEADVDAEEPKAKKADKKAAKKDADDSDAEEPPAKKADKKKAAKDDADAEEDEPKPKKADKKKAAKDDNADVEVEDAKEEKKTKAKKAAKKDSDDDEPAELETVAEEKPKSKGKAAKK